MAVARWGQQKKGSQLVNAQGELFRGQSDEELPVLAGPAGSEAEVARRAAADLSGLVASMSPMAVDLLTGALRPLHSRAWNVEVDEAGLARLRERNRTHPLVFLPSHRSYADPLLHGWGLVTLGAAAASTAIGTGIIVRMVNIEV